MDIDAIFRALGNEVRREMVSRLARREEPVAELAGGFDVSAPAISRHLRILEGAGLVNRRRLGREQLISLDRKTLGLAMGWLEAHGARWQASLDVLEATLTNEREEEPNP